MNLSKKLTYLVTFAVIFLLLPYGVYKLYYKYQSDLYVSMSEYSSYTTISGTYTVALMDTKKFGSEDSIELKIYLINNDTDEVKYIGRKKYKKYGNEITYKEDKTNGVFDILVTMGSGDDDKVLIDCLEGKKKQAA